ncbi:hypothetical protein ADT27_10235 [Xanthomonas oryzae]|uniref:head-tail connector protein n=1 Tax=Xanthomonas oryzae TaxID=347 RepID=UPI0006AC343F|nr:head-tail connector protein [Xanthomonas oryzae]KOR46428.1 hypothetical protein ADT27_10235 [Xanthomonas oryzae]
MITLAMVQRHLQAELYEDDEMDYVMQQLLPAARESAELFINRKLYDTPADMLTDQEAGVDPGDQQLITRTIEQAILLTLGEWYANREQAWFKGSGLVTSSAQNLLHPYRKFAGVR